MEENRKRIQLMRKEGRQFWLMPFLPIDGLEFRQFKLKKKNHKLYSRLGARAPNIFETKFFPLIYMYWLFAWKWMLHSQCREKKTARFHLEYCFKWNILCYLNNYVCNSFHKVGEWGETIVLCTQLCTEFVLINY